MAESDDDGDPKVTVRIPDEDLEVIRAVAADDEHSYSQSHIIRYSMDRKFESREDIEWPTETTQDPVLDDLMDEYRDELGYEAETEVQVEPAAPGEEEDEEYGEDLGGVEVMLDGDADFRDESFKYAMTMYTIGLEKGDETIQELSREYLEENFPEEERFTRHLGGTSEEDDQ
jgi:hypothetical protein